MHVLQLIKNNKPRTNRLGLTRKGFTLVELIVVIAVMAVLLAVLAPSLLNYVEDSRAQKDDSAMIEVVAGIKSSMDSDPDVYDEMYRLAQFIEEEDVYISMHKDTDGSGFTPHVLGKPLEETAPALAQKIKGLVDEPYKVSSATYKDMVYNIYLHRDGDLEIRNVFGKWESEIKINIPTGTPVMPDNSRPNVDHPDRPDTDIPDTDYEPPVPDNPGLGGGGYTKPTAPTTPDPDKTVASFTPPVAISPINPKLKGKVKGTFKYATQMNSIRKQLLKIYPDAIETFGYVTKANRLALNVDKEHFYDACVIATGGNPFTIKSNLYKKKCVADGDFQQTKGIRSEQRIPTHKIQGFRKFDKVLYLGKEYFIKGRMSNGYAILMDIEGNKIDFSHMPKGLKTPKLKNLKRLSARKTWIITTAAVTQNIV